MECVWKIVYFYERLAVALRHHQVSAKLAPDLFGDAFNFWYLECFETKLVGIDDPTAQHILELRTQLKEISTEQQTRGLGALSNHLAPGTEPEGTHHAVARCNDCPRTPGPRSSEGLCSLHVEHEVEEWPALSDWRSRMVG